MSRGVEPQRYGWRLAAGEADLAAAQALRAEVFRGGARPDGDAFDQLCRHVLIEERASGRLVCCFRVLPLGDGAEIGRSYAAQHYGLGALETYRGRMIEVGRFALAPGVRDPDVVRLAWGVLARQVIEGDVALLFGCSSFSGTETAPYADAFALLGERHLAPARWRPRIKAPTVFRFGRRRGADRRRALLSLPPLLRSYLAMGGWVSDHAVVDRDLDTLHVFTGLEVGAIPPARARALRAVAG